MYEYYGLPMDIVGAFAGLSDQPGEHGLSINWNQWDGKDCASAGEHLNPTNEKHGKQGTHPSHLGDLFPVRLSPDTNLADNIYWYRN